MAAPAHARPEGGRLRASVALEQLYALGLWLVRPFGGGPLDGLRLVNALAVVAAAALLFATLQRLGAGRAVSALHLRRLADCRGQPKLSPIPSRSLQAATKSQGCVWVRTTLAP